MDVQLRQSSGLKAVCDMHSLRLGKMSAAEEDPLLSILEETRAFKSTLPSDKIYGVLGLAPEEDRLLVDVDYSTDSGEVFRRFAVACLVKAKSLDVLSHCVYPQELDLPSWVPDWTRRGLVEPFRIRQLQCSAAGETLCRLRIDESGKKLYTAGKIVDKIAAIEELRPIPSEFETQSRNGTASNTESQLHDRMVRVKQSAKVWYRNLVDIAFPEKKATNSTLENLWRTLMCNRTRANEVPSNNCATGFDIFLTAVIHEKTPQAVLQERRDQALANAPEGDASHDHIFKCLPIFVNEQFAEKDFTGAHSKWCHNRRFFRSEAGRFGWAVDGSRPGDEIGIFYGGDYPFVLRPGGSGAHTIVGDCYLHGVMDGEAVDGPWPEHEFCIV